MARNNNNNDQSRTDFDQRRPNDDDIEQTPFYWDDQQIYPFYSVLSDNLAGKSRIFNVSNDLKIIPDKGGAHNQYNSNKELQRLVQTENGTFKSYTGSTKQNHYGDYAPVPQNDLNIMDYARYRGFDYKLLRGQKGIEYRLQWGPESPTGNDFNSTYVALNPQPYYDDNHNPRFMKDKQGNTVKDANGDPKQIQVTGKGAFVRFSKSDLGQGSAGDSLIRFIMEVRGLKHQPDAYAELTNMINDYGSETRFDPQDPDVATPQDSVGEFAYDKDYKPIRGKKVHNLEPDHKETVTNPYEKASDLAELNLHSGVGEKQLQYLKDKLGYTDQQIKDEHIGWFPGKGHDQADQLTRKFQDSSLYGMGINSQLTKVDLNGDAHDRLGGMFTKPDIKNKHIVGMKGLDNNLKEQEHVHNPKVLNYDHNYGPPSAFGFNKNAPNDHFKDLGGNKGFNELSSSKSEKHRQQAREYAMGYLHDKRGISRDVVNSLIDQDLIRVGYGRHKDPQSSAQLKQAHQGYHDTWGDKDHYSQGDFNKRNVKFRGRSNNKNLKKNGYDYPPYIEFAHKLGDEDTRNLMPSKQDTVGADRISFDRDKPGYQPDQQKNDRGKTVVGNSMHNYGFNISYGKKNDSQTRKLYVFEDPIDLMSYLDTHRSELNHSDEPSDLLSLGGSASKTKAIDNYMHHKTDGSDERYSQITFATDNDEKGQKVPLQYTEKARLQMPKSRLDKLFKVETPPYGKDWNDVSKYLRDNHKEYSASDKQREKHNISDFKDKALRDNLSGMTTEGLRTAYHIAKQTNKLHVDYINNGSRIDTQFPSDITDDIKKSEFHMKHLDTNTMKDNHDIYNSFNDNSGNSLQPHEIKSGLEKLVDQGFLDHKVVEDPDLSDVTLDLGQKQRSSQELNDHKSQKAKVSPFKDGSIAQNDDDPLGKFKGMKKSAALNYIRKHSANRESAPDNDWKQQATAEHHTKQKQEAERTAFKRKQNQKNHPNQNRKGPKR